MNRRVLAKIANYMTKKKAKQNEAWESTWRLYNHGWIIPLETHDYKNGIIGLNKVLGHYPAEINIYNATGQHGNTYRRLQIVVGEIKIGFLPDKIAGIFKYTKTLDYVKAEVYANYYEAKALLKLN